MKLFIVLSLVLASALAYESSEYDSTSRNTNSMNGRILTDVNGLTAESFGAMLQRQQTQYRHPAQRPRGQMSNGNENNNEEDDSALGYWASYPDSAAFDAKIKARLSTSKVLGDKPEVRRKITQLAEDKFNQCKVLTDDRERACLGRVTGQIMQLVSAVENMARNPQ
ncbi:uncharacterized protein LOC129939843 [Eupeodes corollae]|uniref:uncharacterized protein LOC129939843 n=1 Tax=Eupeodes corollae TaxID=290404 RepID=UPI002493302E|nr:uncharacterized protein LOC129939843 [Eupeodes corollae]